MFESLYDYVDKETYLKYMRLFCVAAFYLVIRKWWVDRAKAYQIKRQLEMDKKEKEEKPERERKAAEELKNNLEEEAKSFGWGKKTRKSVKISEANLSAQMAELRERQQSAYDEAEDQDIEDLLED